MEFVTGQRVIKFILLINVCCPKVYGRFRQCRLRPPGMKEDNGEMREFSLYFE